MKYADTKEYVNMGTIPLERLKVTSIVYVYGSDPDTGVDADVEVFDKDLLDRSTVRGTPTRCACCGKKLKWACTVTDKETLTSYWIGRQCAASLEGLTGLRFAEGCTKAMAERAKCRKNLEKVAAEHGISSEAIEWAQSNKGHRIANDMIGKAKRFGKLSEKQVAFFNSLYRQYVDSIEAVAKVGQLEEGLQEVAGEIKTLKLWVNSYETRSPVYGRSEWKNTPKANILIETANGHKIWAKLAAKFDENNEVYNVAGIEKGDKIKAKIKVSRTEKDPMFYIGNTAKLIEVNGEKVKK